MPTELTGSTGDQTPRLFLHNHYLRVANSPNSAFLLLIFPCVLRHRDIQINRKTEQEPWPIPVFGKFQLAKSGKGCSYNTQSHHMNPTAINHNAHVIDLVVSLVVVVLVVVTTTASVRI
jgi:hypothetical protein